MRAELMGAQDQIAFKRLLLISSPHCSCSSLAPLLLLSFLYTVSPTHSVSFFSFLSSPQGLDKYSFFPFLVSDEDSLHLSLAPFIFSRFAVFIYHAAHLSRFLPLSLSLSLSPSVSCHLFVFPFSFCHRKLPVLSVSPSRAQHSRHSHVSLVGLLPPLCATLPSFSNLIRPTIPLSRVAGRLRFSRVFLVSWRSLSCRRGRAFKRRQAHTVHSR